MSGEDKISLSALPVFLALGHGREAASIFCNVRERAKRKRTEEKPKCRFLCPENTYIILFSEMGSTVIEPTAVELAKLFRKIDPPIAEMLHKLPHMRGALDTFAPFTEINFRVYTPGSEVPRLYLSPVMIRQLDDDGSTAGISTSGVYQYPILSEEHIDLETTGQDWVTEEVADALFKDSVFPTVEYVKSKPWLRWNQLAGNCTTIIRKIVKNQGPGIYYFPICRLCEGQYHDRAELVREYKKYENMSDAKFEAMTDAAYKNYELLKQHMLNLETDETKVTHNSIPKLRKLKPEEQKINKQILKQRSPSRERQTRIRDEILRGIEVYDSVGSKPKTGPSSSSSAAKKPKTGSSSSSSAAASKPKVHFVDSLSNDGIEYVPSSGEDEEETETASKKHKSDVEGSFSGRIKYGFKK